MPTCGKGQGLARLKIETEFYSLTTEPSLGRMRMRLSGFWSDRIAADFAEHFTLASSETRSRLPPDRELLILADLREHAIFSRDALGEIEKLASGVAKRPVRISIIASSTLQRMQLRRLMLARQADIFLDEREAMDWLFGDGVERPK